MPRRAMLQDARASASDPAVICSFDYEAIDKPTRAIIHQAARFLYVKRGRGKLVIDGEERTAILKELQFHPVTDALLHVDFYEVNDQKPITVGIPVKLNGLAQGVRDGGRMNLSIRKIDVTAKYQAIPEHLDIDVTAMTIGKSIKVGDLHFEGLEMATSKNVVVCSIKATRKSIAASQAEA